MGELHPATQAVHQLSRWRVTGRFTVERRGGGGRETIFTTFDHAHLAARWFDITGCLKGLHRSITTVIPLAQRYDSGYVWSFSDAVPDIPPDTDSTAKSLLLLQRAVEQGFDVADHLLPSRCVTIFEKALARPHGIYTFFGEREANDVDPLVNIGVAELVLRTGVPFSGMSSIVDFLNTRLRDYQWGTPVSEYYLGASFLAERLATLTQLQPNILEARVCSAMDDYLRTFQPTDPLSLAFTAVACRRRGLCDRHRRLAIRLAGQRRSDTSWWGFAPIYIQRTPRYEYGSELLTTLLAIQAGGLSLEAQA